MKSTANAGTEVVGVELDGPRCGVAADHRVKLAGGAMEAGKGIPRASGRAVVTGDPRGSVNTRAAGRTHVGAVCDGHGEHRGGAGPWGTGDVCVGAGRGHIHPLERWSGVANRRPPGAWVARGAHDSHGDDQGRVRAVPTGSHLVGPVASGRATLMLYIGYLSKTCIGTSPKKGGEIS